MVANIKLIILTVYPQSIEFSLCSKYGMFQIKMFPLALYLFVYSRNRDRYIFTIDWVHVLAKRKWFRYVLRRKSASRQESVQTTRICQNLTHAVVSLFGESRTIIIDVHVW